MRISSTRGPVDRILFLTFHPHVLQTQLIPPPAAPIAKYISVVGFQYLEFVFRCPPFPTLAGGAVTSLAERTQAAAPPPPYPAQEEECAVISPPPPPPPPEGPQSARRPAPPSTGGGGATAGDSLALYLVLLLEYLVLLLQPEAWLSAASCSPEDMSVSIDAKDDRRGGSPPPAPPGHGLRFIREPEPAKIGLTTEERSEAGGARRVIVGREIDRVTAASSPRSSSTSPPPVGSGSELKPYRTMSLSRLEHSAEYAGGGSKGDNARPEKRQWYGKREV